VVYGTLIGHPKRGGADLENDTEKRSEETTVDSNERRTCLPLVDKDAVFIRSGRDVGLNTRV